MPTYFNDDQIPTVQFNQQLEISPFKLFRDMRDGKAPLIIDVRTGDSAKTIRGAEAEPPENWEPPVDREVVLIDDDGSQAIPKVEKLHERGFGRVKALFGGIDLYEFSLDPKVVGEDTYLVRAPAPSTNSK